MIYMRYAKQKEHDTDENESRSKVESRMIIVSERDLLIAYGLFVIEAFEVKSSHFWSTRLKYWFSWRDSGKIAVLPIMIFWRCI